MNDDHIDADLSLSERRFRDIGTCVTVEVYRRTTKYLAFEMKSCYNEEFTVGVTVTVAQ